MSEQKKVTVALDAPVEHDGKTIASLTFRKMKARDLVAGDLVRGETRRTFAMFASMAEVPIQVIESLDIDDFEKIGAAVAPLMGKSAQKAMAAAEAEAKAKAIAEAGSQQS